MPYPLSLLWRYKYSLIYVMLVPLINWAFAHTPFYKLPDGGDWSPFSILVGMVLVVRDFSQREIGHYVFVPLVIGVALSFWLAAPGIAIASASAFLVSELADWAVYTFTRLPLSTRVLLSSLMGVPIDTLIFLTIAELSVPGIFSVWTMGSMLVSKIIGAIFVFFWLRQRELRQKA